MLGWLTNRKAARLSAAPVPAQVPATVSPSERKRLEGNDFLARDELEAAAASYREAVRHDAQSVPARINLAYVLTELNRPKEAEEHLLLAAGLDERNVDAAYMLGNIARSRGDAAAALAHFERVIALKPDFELAYRDACLTCVEAGQAESVGALLQRGLSAVPHSAELQFLLANSLQLEGKSDAAIEAYRKVIAARLDHVEAHSNISVALRAVGNLQGAVAHLQRVTALQPGNRDAHLQYGVVLQNLGRVDAAVEAFRRAVAVDPASAVALSCLGSAYAAQRRSAEAIDQYRLALAADPTHAFAHAGLGVVFNELGRPQEAIASLRRAVELDVNAIEAHSSMLFLMSFLAQPDQYIEEARRYAEKVAARAKPWVWPAQAFEPHPKPLRVGFVSGDLRNHPVALFLEGVVGQLDRRSIEVFAYVTNPREDETTARLKPHFSGWRSLVGLNDEAAARRVREDGIHVLIDLAGHTADNRLSMFAWRPAPVQATWLGYLASTGLPCIDYVLADLASLPVEAQPQFVEKPWYLPHSLYCYTAPGNAPAVSPSPAKSSGVVTFGSFQRMNKVSNATLETWAQVLRRVPNARLRIQNKQMASAPARTQLLEQLQQLGVARERVDLAGPISGRDAYLACHEHVDIVLDTFPYPGITTTCEALWMGVPTVTLAGDTLLSRQGASLLQTVGLNEWIASDTSDFIARASAHAADIEALAQLRAQLRDRACASPLFDARQFARDLDRALHEIWAQAGGMASPR